MIVRDLFDITCEERVIARAIFEDRCEPQYLKNRITKYYSLLTKIKNAKVHKSKYMIYMSVLNSEEIWGLYGVVSAFEYCDIKREDVYFYSLECLKPKEYASLYVPEYTVERYGAEVVAAEVLREYGWNDYGYDKNIKCPDMVILKVLKELTGMKQEIFLMDSNYFYRCRKQFKNYYEGKKIPHWDDAKTAEGVIDNRSKSPHIVLM